MPELILSLKGRELQRLSIHKLELTIGRDPKDDIHVNNIGVSRSHVKIRVTSQGDLFALDNQSRNGTYINKKRITTRHKLQHGDTIHLAKYKVQFSASGTPLDLYTLRKQTPHGAALHQKAQGGQGTLPFSPDELHSAMEDKSITPEQHSSERKEHLKSLEKQDGSSKKAHSPKLLLSLMATACTLLFILLVLLSRL